MAALTELMNASANLAALLHRDSRLLLVQAIAWLDPQTLIDDGQSDFEFNYDAEDDLTAALYICREYFPAVYAGVMQLQLQGANEAVLEWYLVEGISARLVVPLQSIEEVRYGPPLDCCGISLEMSEDDADDELMQRLTPVFVLFGLNPGGIEPDTGHEKAVAAASLLVQSLSERSELLYSDLANLLLWLFSMSGNTAVDWTLDMLWESGIDLPDWSPEDVKLINDINAEAREVIASAERALTALAEDTALHQSLSGNIQAALHFVNRKPKKGKRSHVHTDSDQYTDPRTAAFIRRIAWPDRT